MLQQQQTTAACTDSAVKKFDEIIDRLKLAGRQTAASWLGSAVQDAEAYEARVRAMTGCLSSIILAPAITAPVLLMTFAWPHAIAGTLAATAVPVAAAAPDGTKEAAATGAKAAMPMKAEPAASRPSIKPATRRD